MSELAWIAISAAIVLGVSAIATAWAQSKIGAAAAASLAEKPELSGTAIILVAIPEAIKAGMLCRPVPPAGRPC